MSAMSERQPPPSMFTGLKRGLLHRCPNCGDGRLYMRYLKVDPECEACGHALGAYPADDGPAYFTILLVGHLVVAPLLFFPWIWQASPAIVAPVTLIPLALLTLLALPRVKGAVIGALWAIQLRKAEDTPS
ncbi:DUF983 domain-containing protein [uncultured Caulobacter sp.]|uniref:DUF983 domain-containing protein n=1 Tax=uncultured Caulobacter sp. TaxID=158749 RepID=UPI00260D9718|nr:DUF983 domain-containing protein [uncultured Caulobacter sp.]